MVIILILIIFVIFIIFTHKKKDQFTNYNKIDFYDKGKACYLILKNHKEYFLKMEFKESKLRGCIDSPSQYKNILKKCNKYYCQNILSFTGKDRRNLLICLNIILNIYDKYFPRLLSLPWNIIKVSSKIEGGMPHTIKNCIVLPENFLDYLNDVIENNNQKILIDNICSTLIHEQMHVFQKIDYSIFKELYQKYWNFDLCKVKLKKKYMENQRINPDGYDDWCYNQGNKSIYPFVYLKENYKYLNDVDTAAFIMKNNKIDYQKIYKLHEFTDYNQFFCNVSQNYHPNEISAILLSDLIISKINKKNISSCSALKKIIPWINKHLK